MTRPSSTAAKVPNSVLIFRQATFLKLRRIWRVKGYICLQNQIGRILELDFKSSSLWRVENMAHNGLSSHSSFSQTRAYCSLYYYIIVFVAREKSSSERIKLPTFVIMERIDLPANSSSPPALLLTKIERSFHTFVTLNFSFPFVWNALIFAFVTVETGWKNPSSG